MLGQPAIDILGILDMAGLYNLKVRLSGLLDKLSIGRRRMHLFTLAFPTNQNLRMFLLVRKRIRNKCALSKPLRKNLDNNNQMTKITTANRGEKEGQERHNQRPGYHHSSARGKHSSQ